MSYKVTRLGPPRIRRDTIIVGDVVFEAADLAPLTVEDEGTPLATAASTLDFVGAGVTASGTGASKTITIPGGSGLTVEDEGTPLTTDATTLDFVGSGVTASGAGATKTITIPGGSGLTVEDEGTPLTTAADTLDFVGSGVTASGTGTTKTITIPGGSGITVEDEGSPLTTSADTLDFVGAGVTASGSGTTKTITIPGGGGSSRPWLDVASDPLNGTYGDDFDGASLDARWTRIGTTGGMETYQVNDGSHMQVIPGSAAVLRAYGQAISAGDFEFVCSMTAYPGDTATMYGLFVRDSSGAGRGQLFYSGDNVPYHANLNTGSTYNSFNFAGQPVSWQGRHLWYRLRRSGNDITTNYSMDGINWSVDRTVSDSASFNEVFIGRVFGSSAIDVWYIDRFDRVV